MPYDRFLIAPITQGSQSNLKPWLIMDDAFERLTNMYTWRGRIRKRFGARVMNGAQVGNQQQFFTRLRINIGMTDNTGFLAATVPGAIFKIGQAFSVGNGMFTVIDLGTPALLLATNLADGGDFNTTTGEVRIASAPNTIVYYYPAQPVMGLRSYDIPNTVVAQIFAFDTQFAYTFGDATGWQRSATGVSTWTGSDSNFFWATNYRGMLSNDFVLFVTNNVSPDAMRYWDGATWHAFGSAGTTAINPANDYIVTCLLMIPFKDRLLLLNVTENISGVDQTFTNRIRYCQTGSPLEADAWQDGTGPGGIRNKGGFIDAPTKESITGIDILKDRLIVFFESSTWELVWNGNQVTPFQFQKLDNDLGVESTNSVVSFNRVALGFGNIGIHSCNGVNLDRIDQIIPNTIFDVRNTNFGPQRVAGIRDYWVQMVYWSFPSVEASSGADADNVYPNRVLVYDYVNETWAYNDDSITAFGNFFLQSSLTWANIGTTWEQTEQAWDTGDSQAAFQSVIAGNQEGFTFIIDTDLAVNSIGLQITDITLAGNNATITAINHNLEDESFVYFTNLQSLGGNLVANLDNRIFKIAYVSKDTFTITIPVPLTGIYLGGGTITRVSQLNIQTKQYNFYNKVGTSIAVQKVQFLVDRTANGEFFVEYGVSSNQEEDLVAAAMVSGSIVGTGVVQTSPYALVPFEANQARFWHTSYFSCQGENIQLQISLNDDQMTTNLIAFSDLEINAIMFYVTQVQTYGQ